MTSDFGNRLIKTIDNIVVKPVLCIGSIPLGLAYALRNRPTENIKSNAFFIGALASMVITAGVSNTRQTTFKQFESPVIEITQERRYDREFDEDVSVGYIIKYLATSGLTNYNLIRLITGHDLHDRTTLIIRDVDDTDEITCEYRAPGRVEFSDMLTKTPEPHKISVNGERIEGSEGKEFYKSRCNERLEFEKQRYLDDSNQ